MTPIVTKDDGGANSYSDHGDDWTTLDELDELAARMDEEEGRGSSGAPEGEDQGLHLEADVAIGTSS